MNKQQLIVEFEEKTGMSFFSANEHYFADMPDEIKTNYMFSEEDVNMVSDENFKMVYDYLFPLAIWKEKVRKSITAKRINSYFKESMLRCAWAKRRDTVWDWWILGNAFINKDTWRASLLKNQWVCFNPLYQMNDWWNTAPLIFKPSQRLVKKYPFITPEYADKSNHLKQYNVNLEYLKSFERVYVNEWDILDFYLGMYHPYIWALIQNEQFNLLNHTF